MSRNDVHSRRVLDAIGKHVKIFPEFCDENSLLDDILSVLSYSDRASVCFAMKDALGVHVSPFDRIVDVADRLRRQAD